jgi:dTMP kinase
VVQGYFITFEGIEHCGKTTQSEALVDRLQSDGHDLVLTREPGGTPLGQSIRDLLLHQSSTQVDTVAELLLFAADRAQHVNTVIRPALAAGKIVISDRFYDSTRAYQGYGREISIDLIDRAILLATGGLTPDLSILVDIDIVTSRLRSADDTDDRIEQSNDSFFERVSEGFRAIALAEPERFLILDGAESIAEVARRVYVETTKRLTSR